MNPDPRLEIPLKKPRKTSLVSQARVGLVCIYLK